MIWGSIVEDDYLFAAGGFDEWVNACGHFPSTQLSPGVDWEKRYAEVLRSVDYVEHDYTESLD